MITAGLAALLTYLVRHQYGSSWLWFIPIFVAVFFAKSGYRILIYERFLNPLSRLPGPKGHWLFGEFKAIIDEEPGQAHLRWMREYRNPTGLVSYPGLFYAHRLMPFSTSAIQHILNNWTVYVKPERSREALRNILGDGLLTAEGEMHRRQRKVLNPAFATGYVRDAAPIFAEKADDLADLILEDVNLRNPEGVEVFHFLSRCTMDIMGAAGFGYEFKSMYNPNDPFASAYGAMFERSEASKYLQILGNYLPWLRFIPFPRMKTMAAARATIVREATKLVRHKEAQSETGKDILSLMIAENRKAQDEKLADMEMIDQVMTFLLAGHETTSTALCWGLYTLAQNPEIQDRLRAEIKGMDLTYEKIESSRYLSNVCREMLRFVPPVSITNREASVSDVINGQKVPKGTIVFIPIAATNFDEEVWGPDVDIFNPDRWDKLPEKVSNYNYLTFLAGPRSCIGRRFAEVEMKILLAALIQRLRFEEVVKGTKLEKQSIITTRPKGGKMFLKVSGI